MSSTPSQLIQNAVVPCVRVPYLLTLRVDPKRVKETVQEDANLGRYLLPPTIGPTVLHL